MNMIYFISGVNGVGKTSIMPYLLELLPGDKYEVHDFDERGVPPNADGIWRVSETKYWVDLGIKLAQNKDKKIIVCGFVKPADFGSMLFDKSFSIALIFLDARPEIIRERLKGRYTKNGYFDERQIVIGKSINDFIEGNVYISQQMKKMFEDLSYPIIDTSDLTPAEVAKKTFGLILNE